MANVVTQNQITRETYYCIYRITNNINGKTYIGQHKYTDINDRYMGSGVLILAAIRKYGRNNFTKEILYSRIKLRETANSLEIIAIAKERERGKAEYNISDGGASGANGIKYSLEHRLKLSEAHKHYTPEQLLRISKGTKQAMARPEVKEKLRKSKLNKIGNIPRRYIECIDTHEIHYYLEWKKLGFNGSYLVAKGKQNKCKGYKFKFVEN